MQDKRSLKDEKERGRNYEARRVSDQSNVENEGSERVDKKYKKFLFWKSTVGEGGGKFILGKRRRDIRGQEARERG